MFSLTYNLIKVVKLADDRPFVRSPEQALNYGVDLEDDKTWKLFRLYFSPRPRLRDEIVRILDMNGATKHIINKKFDFEIQVISHYVGTRRLNTKETRFLYIPPEIIQGYGIDAGSVIELLLHEVVGEMYGKKYTRLIYENVTYKGPMDVKPINDDLDTKLNHITETLDEAKVFVKLLEKVKFLGVDINWFLSATSLLIHEIAIQKCSMKIGLKLDKNHVNKILGRTVNLQTSKYLSFRDKYDTFSYKIKEDTGIIMPKLPQTFRGMRGEVVHSGYNPQPEEMEAITTFTFGFLDKIRGI